MKPQSLKRLLLAPTAIASLMLAGCLHEQTAVNTTAEVEIEEQSSDPRIEFLVKEADTKRELISVSYDSLMGDTAYIIEPPLTLQEKRRGVKGTGIGFKASQLDKIMKAAEARKAEQATQDPAAGKTKDGLLVKKAHTRWDHWYAPIDVKNLAEVRDVKVFIYKVGPPRLGPNWINGVRAAIANWNAQAKGTAVRFVETQSETDHDISFRGSFGIGSDYMLTSTAFLTADQYMEPDGISLYVNTGYEHTGVPHNQKTTVAMSLLALSTNVTFTGMEGYYWNNGASIHVPGTPATEGDPMTAGSSILTYGTSGASTPVLTAGDLKTFQTIYPAFGGTAIVNSGSAVHTPGVGILDYYVKSFHTSGDTLIYLRHDQKLFRRIGETGANVQIWPGAGSYGGAVQFLYSEGYLAVRTTNNKIYTRTPTGNWINQTPYDNINTSDFRLDGNRLSVSKLSRSSLYSYYLGPTTASSAVHDWQTASWSITDWKVHNGLLVIADAGNVWAMQNYQGWHLIHSASSGPAHNVQVSDHKIALFYTPVGSSNSSVAVRHGRLTGGWNYYTDPIYRAEDIDLCGDKLAFLQQTKYLRVIDYSTGMVHAHYSMPTGNEFQQTKLSGPNCDFVTSRSLWGPAVWAKYGIDLDNQYQLYQGATQKLTQGMMPDP